MKSSLIFISKIIALLSSRLPPVHLKLVSLIDFRGRVEIGDNFQIVVKKNVIEFEVLYNKYSLKYIPLAVQHRNFHKNLAPRASASLY